MQTDSKLLLGFPWPINENSDNNLESLCIMLYNSENEKATQNIFSKKRGRAIPARGRGAYRVLRRRGSHVF
jgi:hypothetical protein